MIRARYWRAIFSLALSGWFGFLACLLGCAQPILLAPRSASAQLPHDQLAPAGSGADDRSCCNHGRSRSRGPRQNQRERGSRCPLDATLLQKLAFAGPAGAGAPPPGLPPAVLPSLNTPAARGEIPKATVWTAGRDILLQAHVLRI